MIPMIMLEIFEHLKRPDKAAEIIKIYFDRFGATKEQLKIYFEKVIKICDFDEQAKTALKLYHLDKGDSSNMFQLCVAIFLQAASKPSEKEREMGFEFASKLAEKVCANNPEYLEMYLQQIEEAKFEYVKEPFLSKNGFIPDGFVDAFIEVSMDSPLLSPEMRELALKKTSEMFHSKMEALKEGQVSAF
uniref:Uncharacterized protein n=1 Tax=Panagrolaimus superbus TaxID=310955 RepID=A0A914YF27_9BILA